MGTSQISKQERQAEIIAENRRQAGLLMADMRRFFRLTAEEMQAKFKAHILTGKLEGLERGDGTLGFSIYRAALNEMRGMFDKEPSKSKTEFLDRVDRIYPKLTR